MGAILHWAMALANSSTDPGWTHSIALSAKQQGTGTMGLVNIHDAGKHQTHPARPRRLGLGKGKFQVPADLDDQNRAAIEAMFYGDE